MQKRLREELAKRQGESNEEKRRHVDLTKEESFGFLGFAIRRVLRRRGVWPARYTPKLKKRTELVRQLKEIFRRFGGPPVQRVVEVIHPIVRGWVQYVAIGDARRCFGFIKD